MNQAAKSYLLLWDIDGTLLHTGRAGELAIIDTMRERFGVRTDLSEIDFSGRTDRWIFRRLLEINGIEITEQTLLDFREDYLERLATLLPACQSEGLVLAGIIEILETARSREDIYLGLLTGNMRRGAELKLGHYKVWHYFEFGAFADDSDIRNDLGPVALDRAEECFGLRFEPKWVYIIGDTPLDVECGKVIGAKTIAVATGRFSEAELAACNPDAVFRDFSHPQSFFDMIASINAEEGVDGGRLHRAHVPR